MLGEFKTALAKTPKLVHSNFLVEIDLEEKDNLSGYRKLILIPLVLKLCNCTEAVTSV